MCAPAGAGGECKGEIEGHLQGGGAGVTEEFFRKGEGGKSRRGNRNPGLFAPFQFSRQPENWNGAKRPGFRFPLRLFPPSPFRKNSSVTPAPPPCKWPSISPLHSPPAPAGAHIPRFFH